MDVVYILGSGSRANNDEVRYSIRSLESFALDLDTVWIVGERPSFFPEKFHIPAEDSHDEKWKNAFSKTVIAAKDDRVADDFLLMNDDFFMLEPFEAAEYPFYARAGCGGGACGPLDYALHCPIRIRSEWFLAMPFDLTQSVCKSPRTFYANFYNAPPTYANDCIVRPHTDVEQCDIQTKDKNCCSISDKTMLNRLFKEWIDKKFPDPSSYETDA